MTRGLLVGLALLAGCDAVFGLSETRDAGMGAPGDGGGGDGGALDGAAPPPCIVDEFSGAALGPDWDTYADLSCTTAIGAPCRVVAGSGEVRMVVTAATGYVGATRPARDFQGERVEVEVRPALPFAPGTDGYLSVALDASNQLRFLVDIDADGNPAPLLTWTRVERKAPNEPETRLSLSSTAYSATAHRYWQVAQVMDSNGPALAFSTRASDAEPWLTQRVVSVPESFAMTVLEIGAGRYSLRAASVETAYAFDNFAVCPPSP